MDAEQFLSEHRAVRIKVGQSGADVYEIDGKYVLKHVLRRRLKNEQFDTYAREALFYQSQSGRQPAYLPEVLIAEASKNEILILMKKYDRPQRDAVNADLLRKITKSLAALHTDDPPSFMRHDKATAETLSDQRIAACLNGWNSVLAEYPGAFHERVLEDIASHINELILWHDSEERVLAHGDFHWDNLLVGEHGRILLCDWQGVHVGGASGDLSFFLSRLGADGVQFDTAPFLDSYAAAIRARTGKQIKRQDIVRHMSAANVITSFVFWHEYLHGSSEERTRDIYGKMTKDFERWNSL